MSVTNLTNTIWYLNETLGDSGWGSYDEITFNITFTSNENTYNSLYLYSDFSSPIDTCYINNDSTMVYDGWTATAHGRTPSWTNDNYRIIKIIGGGDVRNSIFIEWLENEAVQLKVDNLTNTTWIWRYIYFNEESFDDTYNLESKYNISFTSNSSNYTYISFSCNDPDMDIYDLWYCTTSTWQQGTWTKVLEAQLSYYDQNEYTWTWTNNNYKRITITGGTDVTNPNLIRWLTRYASLVTTYTYDLTQLSLTNEGVYQITGKANAVGCAASNWNGWVGYAVFPQLDTPTSVSVSNTTASFDAIDKAGQYEFFVDGQSIGTYSVTTSGYNVLLDLSTSAFGYGQDTYYATYIKVYDGTSNAGTLLASDISPTAPTTKDKSYIRELVNCQTGNIYIEWYCEYSDGMISEDWLQTGSSNCTVIHSSGSSETAQTTISITGNPAVIHMSAEGLLD